jgi:hypothetical protein
MDVNSRALEFIGSRSGLDSRLRGNDNPLAGVSRLHFGFSDGFKSFRF